jgi:hypothetical protein
MGRPPTMRLVGTIANFSRAFLAAQRDVTEICAALDGCGKADLAKRFRRHMDDAERERRKLDADLMGMVRHGGT